MRALLKAMATHSQDASDRELCSIVYDKKMIIADWRNTEPASGLTVTMRVRIISKCKAGTESELKKPFYLNIFRFT